ncbi:retrovirus-related pol polyprotein from transposon TNT 1-94 [Tanacetum coccineum]
MQEELNQFIANDVWELVPQPRNMTIIGTKWVFRNKLDENGVVSRNKARLESIRILLAYACALDFKLFQMDVRSALLNGFINEEVYVAQPLGFINFEKLNHVYNLKKALYGLKKVPKAWYDRLKAFFIKHEYKMGMVDNTLFTKKKSSNLIIVQIYVDDIIFSSTRQDMCDEFAKIMHDEFEMSMMGELNFFLGLQIKQMEDGIFFNQSKYIKEMLKKFSLEDSKPMKTTHMSSILKLTKDKSVSRRYTNCIEVKISQYHLDYSDEGQMLIQFVIQNNFFSHTLEEFGQILGIPYKGAYVYTDKWSLDDLQYSVPRDGPYQTDPPCPDDIKNYIQEEREGPVTRIRHKTVILVEENEILTREIVSTMKPWVEIIRSEKFNLAYFIAKRMEFVTKQARLILPYERKTRKDYGMKRGRHSTSSSSAFDQPSSSHLNDDDDDDGNDEGTSRASTPSPTCFVNSLTNELRDEHRGGLRSIGKGFKNLLRNMKK